MSSSTDTDLPVELKTPGQNENNVGLRLTGIFSVLSVIAAIFAAMPLFSLSWWRPAGAGFFLLSTIGLGVLGLVMSSKLSRAFYELKRKYCYDCMTLSAVERERKDAVLFTQLFPVTKEQVDAELRAIAKQVLTAHEKKVDFYTTSRGRKSISVDPETALKDLRDHFSEEEQGLECSIRMLLQRFYIHRDSARRQGYIVHDSWKTYVSLNTGGAVTADRSGVHVAI